jgi:CheY-like chemotaxis protein
VPSQQALILIIEDDQLVASYLEEVLTATGFQVAGIAASGSEALALAAQHQVQLALVDIQLPGPMDGIALARLMRLNYNIPVIFLSAAVDPEAIRRAAAAQPFGFLHKPFVPSQVFNAIELALEADCPPRSRPSSS